MENMESNIEKFRYGSFEPLPEEVDKIRQEATQAGKNPDEAERELRKKMQEATARKHEEEGNKARLELEKGLRE